VKTSFTFMVTNIVMVKITLRRITTVNHKIHHQKNGGKILEEIIQRYYIQHTQLTPQRYIILYDKVFLNFTVYSNNFLQLSTVTYWPEYCSRKVCIA
jgi:hypothetical protein